MSIYGSIKPPFRTALNRQHPLAQGLVSMWNFSEGCGDLVHDSCGMNDGKMIGMAPFSGTSGWVPGPHGAALAFDGSNDYAIKDDNAVLRLTTTGTLSARFMLAADAGTNDFRGIISKRGGDVTMPQYEYCMEVIKSTGNKLNIEIGNGATIQSLMSLTSLLINVWYRAAFVWNAGVWIIYVNGILDNSASGKINCQAATNPLYIGRRATTQTVGYAGFFNGLISSVSIYNRALSAQEIAYLYAFPWCMYDSPMSTWEYNQQNRNFDHYYRRLMAA